MCDGIAYDSDIIEEINNQEEPVDKAKVIIHVTAEEYGYFRHEFRSDNNGDFIRITNEMGIDTNISESTNQDNSTDTNHYVRISKSRYSFVGDRYVRNDQRGTFVKIANREGELIEVNDSPQMINIENTQRYRKHYVVTKNSSTWNRDVNHFKIVPIEFGTHIESQVNYGTIANRGTQTTSILRSLYNYNAREENVEHGRGNQFKYFSFVQRGQVDGNYIQEILTGINDWGDKWSPDSGTARATANYNNKPYYTYKMFFYRSDDTTDDTIENPLTAKEKIDADLENGNRDNAEMGDNGQPVIYEIARHTRTNNFSYYRRGGPIVPNTHQGQPDYYEINYVPSRFRVVLPEEDYASNFQFPDTTQVIKNVTDTYNNKTRISISLDKYSSSNDLEGCIGIMGRYKDSIYLRMANGAESYSWNTWNDLLIEHIPELGEVFGREGYQNIEVNTAETRTRVFMKVDALPHIPTAL